MSARSMQKNSQKAGKNESPVKLYKIHGQQVKSDSITDEIHKKKIGFKTSNGIHIVDKASILRCESIENYCRVYLRDGSNLFLSKTLKSVQEVLCSKSFYRVHNSHLVSVHYISRIENQEIRLSDGTMVPLSRRKKIEFMDYINQQIAVV